MIVTTFVFFALCTVLSGSVSRDIPGTSVSRTLKEELALFYGVLEGPGQPTAMMRVVEANFVSVGLESVAKHVVDQLLFAKFLLDFNMDVIFGDLDLHTGLGNLYKSNEERFDLLRELTVSLFEKFKKLRTLTTSYQEPIVDLKQKLVDLNITDDVKDLVDDLNILDVVYIVNATLGKNSQLEKLSEHFSQFAIKQKEANKAFVEPVFRTNHNGGAQSPTAGTSDGLAAEQPPKGQLDPQAHHTTNTVTCSNCHDPSKRNSAAFNSMVTAVLCMFVFSAFQF
ncbi:merozoite surface antigen-2c [Babesia caballi]|uniref:Merozoite surface antigen-2c n=1 Tax=Babesia caballi TaxID=5871 RepID=A0AAV4LWJ1_BABCB|nr:merozoite surface antigen-2c [Babesia caballi]